MYPRIRELRKAQRLSMKQVSLVAECTVSTYRKHENGSSKLPVRVALKLSEFYGVSVDYLVGRTDTRADW